MRSIHDNLMNMRMDDLADAVYRVGIRLKSHSQEEMCAALEQQLEKPESIWLFLELDQWDAIANAVKDKSPEGALKLSLATVKRDDHLKEGLRILQHIGMAYRDSRAWHIQPQVLVNAAMDEPKRRMMMSLDYIHHLMNGYLRLYGLLPLQEMVRMISGSSQRDPDTEATLKTLHRVRTGFVGNLMIESVPWLANPEVDDPEDLYHQVMDEDMLNRPYAAYSDDEALYAWKEGLPGRVDAYDEMLECYHQQGLSWEESKRIVSQAVTLMQNSYTEKAIVVLSEPIKNIISPPYMRAVGLLIARVPMWHLKGRCMEDLMPSNVRLTTRVRQDDPCPCGSGKKYKNCCGRLQ